MEPKIKKINSPDKNETEVLVVGAGPTGLMMACQLAIHNIRFRIIDKTEDHTTQSRAMVLQARSLEIFDQMGIAQRAIEIGQIADGFGAFFHSKSPVKISLRGISESSTHFPFLLMLEQAKTEKLLSDFLMSQGHFVERKSTFISFEENEQGIISIIKNTDGIEEKIYTKYIIGCDGTHSQVREQMNLPFIGSTYPQSLFVLDCKLDITLPENEFYFSFNGKYITGLFPLKEGRYRILGTVPDELEGSDTITFNDIKKGFEKRVPVDISLRDPEWISMYHAHHQYAPAFKKGNCFIAGDAAHIHSPIGGQGMNTGLQDAYNLAWKLSLVIKGKAPELLLNTYTEERLVVAKKIVRTTDTIFYFVSRQKIRKYITPVLWFVFSQLMSKRQFFRKFIFRTVSEIGIQYRKSPLSQNASFGDFDSDAPKPGDRLPFLIYKNKNGEKLNIQDRVKGKTFHLFIFSKDNLFSDIGFLTKEYEDILTAETIPFSNETEIIFKTLSIANNGYYLIRPDLYIAYRSSKNDYKQLKKYLSRFLITGKTVNIQRQLSLQFT